ncbi:MAG: peptide ABC transporter substrate-binding protein [Oligoflexia bacterium]
MRTELNRLLCFVFFAVVLSGCVRKGAKLDPADARTLRVHLASEPASADPSLFEDGLGLKVLSNTVETLVGQGADGKLELRAAESYTVSKDGLTYRFVLRPGLKWSDGVALEPLHFKTGIERTLNPKTAAKLAPLLSAIDTVTASSSSVLEIRLKKRTPYFVQVLGLPIAAAQRSDVLEKNGGSWPATGPSAALYGIVSRKVDREWLLEANPHRLGELAPDAPQRVRLVIVSDEHTALALFEQGRLDLLARVPPLEVPRLKEQKKLNIVPFWATYYVGFNTRRPALQKASSRCRLAASIKKAEIVAALKGGESVAESWIPPGLEGYQSKPFEFEPSNATPDRLKLLGIFDSNPRNQLILEKVQADFKAVGASLELSNMDWKSFLKELKSGNTEVFRMGWLAAFADPISHMQVLTTGNPNNLTGWSSPAYDRLVTEIEGLPPGKLREQRVLEAQRLALARECVVVPIYHYVQVQGVGPRVGNFAVNGMGVVRWAGLRLL